MTSPNVGGPDAGPSPADARDGFGIFLVHEGETFELILSGRLVGQVAAHSVLRAISLLPKPCVSLVDLSEVSDMDERTARALREGVAGCRDAGGLVCLVCPSEHNRARLIAAGFGGRTDLHDEMAAARRSLLTASLPDVAPVAATQPLAISFAAQPQPHREGKKPGASTIGICAGSPGAPVTGGLLGGAGATSPPSECCDLSVLSLKALCI